MSLHLWLLLRPVLAVVPGVFVLCYSCFAFGLFRFRAASHRPLGCTRTRLCRWRPFALALLLSDFSAKGGDLSALFSTAFLGTYFTILLATEFGWEEGGKRVYTNACISSSS